MENLLVKISFEHNDTEKDYRIYMAFKTVSTHSSQYLQYLYESKCQGKHL